MGRVIQSVLVGSLALASACETANAHWWVDAMTNTKEVMLYSGETASWELTVSATAQALPPPNDGSFSTVTVTLDMDSFLGSCDGCQAAADLAVFDDSDDLLNGGGLVFATLGSGGAIEVEIDGVFDDCEPLEHCTRTLFVEVSNPSDATVGGHWSAVAHVQHRGRSLDPPDGAQVHLRARPELD